MDFFLENLSLRWDVGRDGDGEALEYEPDDGERALDFGMIGFVVGFAGDFVDEADEEEDGERFFIGSCFRALTGLRLCCGDCDGERRRSRRFNAGFVLDLS